MTATKEKLNIAKKCLTVFLMFLTLFSVFSFSQLDAYAAKGSTYTVVTKANYWYPGKESITIKQKKQKYYSNWKKTKTKKTNMTYTVVCTPWDSSKKTIKKTLTKSSMTIKLDKNTKYTVKITAYPQPNDFKGHGVAEEGRAYISGAWKATYW